MSPLGLLQFDDHEHKHEHEYFTRSAETKNVISSLSKNVISFFFSACTPPPFPPTFSLRYISRECFNSSPSLLTLFEFGEPN